MDTFHHEVGHITVFTSHLNWAHFTNFRSTFNIGTWVGHYTTQARWLERIFNTLGKRCIIHWIWVCCSGGLCWAPLVFHQPGSAKRCTKWFVKILEPPTKANALHACSLKRAFSLLDTQNSTFNQIIQGAFQVSMHNLHFMTTWGRYDNNGYFTKGIMVNIIFQPLVFQNLR